MKISEEERKERKRKQKAEYAAKYYAANRERLIAASIKWQKSNPDKRKAACRAWVNAHKDQVKAYRDSNKEKIAGYYEASKEKYKRYAIAYQKANPEKKRIYVSNRRAAIQSSGKLSQGLSEKLFKLQKGKCACCRMPLGAKYHMDHIMPLALGGTNTDDNIQLLHSHCNVRKQARHPVDFMQSRGYLL